MVTKLSIQIESETLELQYHELNFCQRYIQGDH